MGSVLFSPKASLKWAATCPARLKWALPCAPHPSEQVSHRLYRVHPTSEPDSNGLYLVHPRASLMGSTVTTHPQQLVLHRLHLVPRQNLTWATHCPTQSHQTISHGLVMWALPCPPVPQRQSHIGYILSDTVSHGLYLVHQRQSHMGSNLSTSPPDTVSHRVYLVWHGPPDSLTWAIHCLIQSLV